ncbi:MAG: DedA family protein [Gemmatimonadaceae bacterium]
MLHWIAHLVSSLNYWGVAILMAIENIVLPIPSELIMPLAGFRTAGGNMTLLGVTIAGTIGSVAGSLPLYYAGHALGENRLRKWVGQHGRWFLLRESDLDRAARRFKGNNFVAVIVAQLLPGARGLISLPAGMARMNIALFLLANFIGTLVWCGVLAVAGRLLGANFARIHKFLGPIGWMILGLIVIGALTWVVLKRRKEIAA